MNISIRTKIIVITIGILALGMGANTWIGSQIFSDEYSRVLESRGLAIAQDLKLQLDRLLSLKIPLHSLVGFDEQCRDLVARYKDTSYAMVVDLEGRVLFHNEPSRHNEVIDNHEILRDIRGGGETIQIHSLDGVEYFDVVIPIFDRFQKHIAAVRVGYPVKIITRKVRRLITFSIVIGLVVLVFGVVLSLMTLSFLVTKPLYKLVNVIDEVREKGTKGFKRLGIKSGDEIGRLGAAFDEMAMNLRTSGERIQQHAQELEKKVDERTRELKSANAQLKEDMVKREQVEKKRRELERQLQRAQKMEAVGALAGGVAHDLNNILSGLVSYPDLLLIDMAVENPMRDPLLRIRESGRKAASIVEDMLTLARRGVVIKEVINLNEVILEHLQSPECMNLKYSHSLARTMTDLDDDLPDIQGSPLHLSKTVMNLMSNAMEAMPDGGEIVISTTHRYFDEPIRGYKEVREGEYVVLSVEDNGVGIPAVDLDRIFEPFYTRKVMGRSGTGLGMAVVWGAVEDHNGYIDVRSEEGEGTRFDLYFPVTRREPDAPLLATPIRKYMGDERILVVDDVAEQRMIAKDILTRLGYIVETASSGEEAIERLREKSADIVILDMIMDPGMDGLDAYKKILEIHPTQKAIIASGFSETTRVREALRLGGGAYIKKPYGVENLGMVVRLELDKGA